MRIHTYDDREKVYATEHIKEGDLVTRLWETRARRAKAGDLHILGISMGDYLLGEEVTDIALMGEMTVTKAKTPLYN